MSVGFTSPNLIGALTAAAAGAMRVVFLALPPLVVLGCRRIVLRRSGFFVSSVPCSDAPPPFGGDHVLSTVSGWRQAGRRVSRAMRNDAFET